MRKIWQHIRSRVLAGIVFLIPLFVIIIILQKLWDKLTGVGAYLSKLLGLKPILGAQSVTIATSLILLLLFYIFGWMVKISMLNKSRDWIERTILQYIPGYLTYKAQLQERINPTKDSRVPVLVNTAAGIKPGLLVEEQTSEAVVFFPNSPDSNNGEVLLVEKQQVTKLNMNTDAFIKSLQQFGKDLALAKPGGSPAIAG